jgi:hypothetical protein
VCGVAAAVGLGFLGGDVMAKVCLPGAVALGALLGWCAARLTTRWRIAVMMALGLAAAVANAALSGVVDWAAGDPMHLHEHGAIHFAAVGLIGVVVLWWAVVPIGLAAGALVGLATPRRRA